MSREDELEERPERVIILDAEDPMREIHGRFVWQDEHDRVVEEVRQQAFAEGYDAARRDATGELQSAPVRVELRRRRTVGFYIKLGVLCMLALFVLLMLPIVFLGS